jgi:hypothetical protein
VPEAERPPTDDNDNIFALLARHRRVDDEPVPVADYHGDINFYTGDGHGGWWEYCARFTDGVCARITLIGYTPPAALTPPGMDGEK